MFLNVANLTTGYGKKQVLTDVSFGVDQGEAVLLSGGNGSGKSTALKAIYGLLKPWDTVGRIHFEGNDITSLPTASMIRCGIVYMPQKKNVFEDFTVEENLLTSASIYKRKEAKERVERVYERLPKLRSMRKRTPFNMSGGERQILAFGIALLHNPKLFLLDEPFAGVDATNSEVLFDCIKDLLKESITFIIVEHKMQLLEAIINKEIKLYLGGIEK